jgi:predicted amidohydrolase
VAEPGGRRSSLLRAGAALLAFFGASHAAFAEVPERLRVHAIAYRHSASDAESFPAYREHLSRLADEAVESETHRLPGTPRLFLFPEDSALYALFAGARGKTFRQLAPLLSRAAGNGAALAVVGLFAAYQPQAAYYRAKFPEQNLSEARVGLLALTDSLYRSFFETFGEIARRHSSWVVAAANIAPAEIVTDPPRVALLGDPEAAGRPCGEVPWPCAYEASSPNVYNQAFVFDPQGRLVLHPDPSAREGPLDGAVKKTYLVPIEQGPAEQGKVGLDLAYGSLRQVRPIEIAGIRTGILISKPAWMLDEVGRLEAYDAELLLQPEAFSSWGAPVEDWSPDVLKQSSWQKVQKHGPFRYGVLAGLTGNFFDLVFDAQSHVVEKSTDKNGLARGYIGEPRDVGWLALAPWVVGDLPGEECDRPTLAARRRCLAEVAQALAPGSGDPRENRYLEARAAAVLDFGSLRVDSSRHPGILGSNFPLDPSPQARQRNPQAALGPTGETYVVWQDARGGPDQIRIVRIDSDGETSQSRLVAPGPVPQRFPQVAVAPSGWIHVVWQELEPRPHLVRVSAPSFDGDFAPPLPVATVLSGVEEQWAPAIAADEEGRLHMAWIGLSGGFDASTTRACRSLPTGAPSKRPVLSMTRRFQLPIPWRSG